MNFFFGAIQTYTKDHPQDLAGLIAPGKYYELQQKPPRASRHFSGITEELFEQALVHVRVHLIPRYSGKLPAPA